MWLLLLVELSTHKGVSGAHGVSVVHVASAAIVDVVVAACFAEPIVASVADNALAACVVDIAVTACWCCCW